MSYSKHIFKSGGKLYATQLNEMEEQIAKNEADISALGEQVPTKEDLSDIMKQTMLDLVDCMAFDPHSNYASAISAFKEAWKVTGSTQPDTPTDPEEPDGPPTPTRTLQSISATYTGGDVDAGTLATELTGITVTGHYNVEPLTETVTGWTISGTVAEGTNTFTISYSGKTTTIIVTGVSTTAPEDPTTYDYITEGLVAMWDAEYEYNSSTTLKDMVGNTDIPIDYGVVLDNGWIDFGNATRALFASHNLTVNQQATVEVTMDLSEMEDDKSAAVFSITGNDTLSGNYKKSLNALMYKDGTVSPVPQSANCYICSDSPKGVKTFVATYNAYVEQNVVVNGNELIEKGDTTHNWRLTDVNKVKIGGIANNDIYLVGGKIKSIRLYDRILTSEEIAINHAIDMGRLG